MNTITIELHPDDRKRLDKVVDFLDQIAGEQKQYNEFIASLLSGYLQANVHQSEPTAQNPDAVHPVDEVSPHAAPEPAAEPEPVAAEPVAKTEPQYTLDDVRAIVQRLIAPGSKKREAAKAIVEEYAPKLSAIPVDKYAEAVARLTALEKGGN